jgi:hypothetical protein
MDDISPDKLVEAIRMKLIQENGNHVSQTASEKQDNKNIKENKSNYFAIINFETNEERDYFITIKDISKSINDEPTALLKISKGNNIVMSSLPEGQYYFCHFGLLHFQLPIHDITMNFSIIENFMNYIGTFNIQLVLDENKLEFEYINNKKSFEDSKQLLKNKYPDINL